MPLRSVEPGRGESTDWVLPSSSHSEVVRSSSRRFCWRWTSDGRDMPGAGRMVGGNNTVNYCWIMGRSFLPAWKAWRPSHKDAPMITPQSTTCPSKAVIMTPAFCFGILYVLRWTQPTSKRKLGYLSEEWIFPKIALQHLSGGGSRSGVPWWGSNQFLTDRGICNSIHIYLCRHFVGIGVGRSCSSECSWWSTCDFFFSVIRTV